MKFIPFAREHTDGVFYFCIQGGTHRPSERKPDVCDECHDAPSYCHMNVSQSDSVYLCVACYEMYAPIAGLMQMTGA